MQRLTLILLLWGSLTTGLVAQQDPMFTKYMFNSLVFNPAYAGSNDFLSANVLHRSQWLGWQGSSDGINLEDGGAPTTQTFTLHSPIKDRVALGFSAINDQIGAKQSTSINFAYAYRIPFGKGNVAVGLQGGAMFWRADWTGLKYRDAFERDPAFAERNTRAVLPKFGAGLYYNSEHFYLGFSAPSLLNIDLPGVDSIRSNTTFSNARLYRHYYFTVGGAVPLYGPDLMFKPSLLVKTIGFFQEFTGQNASLTDIGAPTQFDLDLSLLFYRTFWIGISFRSSIEAVAVNKSSVDSGDVWVAFYLNNGMRIGAAYDYSLTRIQNYSAGSLELLLGYEFDYRTKKVMTPRYF